MGGPWPAQAPAAIGALRGLHHATLEPSATWPMHIQEDLQGVTYVVAGALEHADNQGNRGVLTAGGVQRRWLGWGSEHEEWNPSPFAPTEFIQSGECSEERGLVQPPFPSGPGRRARRVEPISLRADRVHQTLA